MGVRQRRCYIQVLAPRQLWCAECKAPGAQCNLVRVQRDAVHIEFAPDVERQPLRQCAVRRRPSLRRIHSVSPIADERLRVAQNTATHMGVWHECRIAIHCIGWHCQPPPTAATRHTCRRLGGVAAVVRQPLATARIAHTPTQHHHAIWWKPMVEPAFLFHST